MKKSTQESEAQVKKTPRFHMEMDSGLGGATLLVLGVRRIEEYSGERLVLQIAGAKMHLVGIGLCLSVFDNKTVEVRGRLLEVKFSYGRY